MVLLISYICQSSQCPITGAPFLPGFNSFGLAREAVWRKLCGSCRTIALTSWRWKASELDQHNISNIKGASHSGLGKVHRTKLVWSVVNALQCSKNTIQSSFCLNNIFIKYLLFVQLTLSPPTHKTHSWVQNISTSTGALLLHGNVASH